MPESTEPNFSPLSHDEQNSLAQFLSNGVVVWYYYKTVSANHASGAYDAADAYASWAQTALWCIFGGIIVTIVATILVSILHAIITNNPNPDFTIDERDRALEQWGNSIAFIVAGIILVGILIKIALGASVWWALHGFLAAISLGHWAGLAAKILRARMAF